MFDVARRRFLLSALILAWCAPPARAQARRETLRLATSERAFDVVAFRIPGPSSRPAVLVLGGSKGYASPAYALLVAALNGAGADAFLIGYLDDGDAVAMRSAASARARIVRQGERMADWADTIRITMEALSEGPRPPTRFGLLGISLGAMTALTAMLNGGDVSAIAIVDGSLPDHVLARVRSLPPLLTLWGEADRVFPVGTGAKLDALARRLGGPARLVTYAGQGHAFFVEDGNPAAAAARTTIAEFFARHL